MNNNIIIKQETNRRRANGGGPETNGDLSTITGSAPEAASSPSTTEAHVCGECHSTNG